MNVLLTHPKRAIFQLAGTTTRFRSWSYGVPGRETWANTAEAELDLGRRLFFGFSMEVPKPLGFLSWVDFLWGKALTPLVHQQIVIYNYAS